MESGQGVFAGRPDQAIGDEDEGAVGVRNASLVVAFTRLAEEFVEDGSEPQLVEEGANDEGGPEGPGLKDLDVGRLAGNDGVAAQDADEVGEEWLEEILAAEVGDDPLFDFAVEAEGLDDAEVLVDGAVGGGDFDGTDEHEDSITPNRLTIKSRMANKVENDGRECHYAFGENRRASRSKPQENKLFAKTRPEKLEELCQTWANKKEWFPL